MAGICWNIETSLKSPDSIALKSIERTISHSRSLMYSFENQSFRSLNFRDWELGVGWSGEWRGLQKNLLMLTDFTV